jgi:glycosyltransferase involved in cell wall biosynthesis
MTSNTQPARALHVMLGLPFTSGGPSYTCAQVTAAMDGPALAADLYASIDRWPKYDLTPPVRTSLPASLRKLPFRYTRRPATALIERRFATACKRDGAAAIAYLWGEPTLALARRLSEQGTLVVREKINCGKTVASQIMHAAYASLDALDRFDSAPYSLGRLSKEQEELDLADYVFCPSPRVVATLRAVGIPDRKLIPTSYGYDPVRLKGTTRAMSPIAGATFLFVGYICVRKGAHILLEAWSKAGVSGRLILLGRIEPLIAERYAHILARPDVEHHAFTADVGSYYRSADYFIFPTLEEGGPQVTYEAASLGIPSIVSPMGAGAIVRDGVDGDIVASDSVEDWAAHIAGLDRHSSRYAMQAMAAGARATDFTWDKVGALRRERLLERVAAECR